MSLQTPLIPAKAGTQIEGRPRTKQDPRVPWMRRMCFVIWFPAFAGMSG